MAQLLDVAPLSLMTLAPVSSLVGAWTTAATPPPLLTVSEWADTKRRLPETSGAVGGRWRTSSTPYLRGIMDSVHEPGVRKIAVRKGAQIGGSEALHNIIGYFIEHDPCPMLFVHPTAHVAEEWSKERLADMIRSTPALAAVVQEGKIERGQHQGESTLALKMFPGGYLALGGANTPNTFARRSVRIAMGDDVDRFPAVVGDEGDPADLLVNRTTTFYDALAIFVSTPTLKGGRIDTLYERSDKRQYIVACPACEHEDWITWNGSCGDPKCGRVHFKVAFEERDSETAHLVCPECRAQISEPDRRRMIIAASLREDSGWMPTAEAQEAGLVGFHAPSMLSTLGNVTLGFLVDKWLSAQSRGKEALRVFINTSLAEGWEDRGSRMEPQGLMNRREEYGEDVEVPEWAAALTAGVDVQDDRFELQVMAWGQASERAVVDWRSIPGDPKKPETRAALLEALTRRYHHALGVELPIHATCIDSGYATEDVYDFVLANQARRIFATKGIAGKGGEPIVYSSVEKRRGQRARPVKLHLVNVDDAKAEIYDSLAKRTEGPNSTHFPLHLDTVNEEYFAQLCSEHKETRYNKVGIATHVVWVQDRDRNEALDTAVLALAANRLLNPNIRQMLDAIVAHAASTASPATTATTPVATPQPARPSVGRRTARSGYLAR